MRFERMRLFSWLRPFRHVHRQRALAIVLLPPSASAELLVQAGQRAMRADLERLVVGELERRFEERLRLAPQLLMQTEPPEREQAGPRVLGTILVPRLSRAG